ncbi:DMT family transporter [Aestuariispira insulae]|uniref:EamA domain-containing membrane protein RarD n=1 Tax=Aestuariispira insulae TaxID=1461337 RepID=A0A3D9HJM5_9PROT|nr:DMT family transporter [Aestuariispira insulae]RED49116.1 EamA domain-containing membrane protein RarD [Aestuariispira insulae]
MTELRATLIGSTAVLLWGALALFTTWTGEIPPFQLVAMTFSMAFLLAAVKWVIRGEPVTRHLRHDWPVWALGVLGLFGYHFFYFMALRNAPAVDASLIAYLWPLLIVVFSALLPGESLRWYHLAGALLGLGGCALLVTNGGQIQFRNEYLTGYLAAMACALTWSTYSVVSRKFGKVPTDTVGWFCGATALLGLFCHLLFETTVWPGNWAEWLAVIGLGLGPVGAAFFTWDIGVKRGNIKALGAFSYAAPLLSALLLILFGQAQASWPVLAACLAIVGGAVLAAKDMFFRRKALKMARA